MDSDWDGFSFATYLSAHPHRVIVCTCVSDVIISHCCWFMEKCPLLFHFHLRCNLIIDHCSFFAAVIVLQHPNVFEKNVRKCTHLVLVSFTLHFISAPSLSVSQCTALGLHKLHVALASWYIHRAALFSPGQDNILENSWSVSHYLLHQLTDQLTAKICHRQK